MKRRLTAGLAGLAVLAVLGVATTATAEGGDTGPTAPPRHTAAAPAVVPVSPATPLVLVSGRDDHGELASTHVALYAAPGSHRPVAEVHDGTLARVVAVEGTWLRVKTREGAQAEGWVDDFHLRRPIHLVGPAPTSRAQLDGRALPAGEQAVVLDVEAGRARVQLLHGAATGWVTRGAVHELAPRHGCGSAPSDATAGHSHGH
ncbi:SH3 domain-containing protein [Terrabacter terrigena]|uniref:SH3 domain-containing protein n=1 Tax=Terrabacter terrigena TaxID=574718 RepID=A0ABW3N174_9MICO